MTNNFGAIKTSTLSSFLSQDFESAARTVHECGLDGIDLDRLWEQPIDQLAASGLYEPLQAITKKMSLKVFCLASGLFRCWLDSEAAFQAQLKTLDSLFRLSGTLNCSVVRCYAFMRDGDLEDNWTRLVTRFKEAAAIAARHGLILGVQNDAETFLGTGREVGRLLDAVGSNHLQAVWDPAASVFDVYHPEIPYPDGYRALQGRTAHIMLRDIDTHKHRGGLLCEVEFGEGIIDYRSQLRALTGDGYNGAVSFSSLWRPGIMWQRDIDEGDFTEDGVAQVMRFNLYNLRGVMNPDSFWPPMNADEYVDQGKIRHE